MHIYRSLVRVLRWGNTYEGALDRGVDGTWFAVSFRTDYDQGLLSLEFLISS